MKSSSRKATWGGKREGAGRKPKGPTAGVPHQARERFPSRYPVHITMRTLPAVGSLGAQRLLSSIEAALREARERFGLRVVHCSVQKNDLHFIVEAAGAASLRRGVQGLAIRIARGINRVRGRHGKVFADRYHARSLGTRLELANALRHVDGAGMKPAL